jgi:alpha-tubulin suppressor-like RCC1 family protein
MNIRHLPTLALLLAALGLSNCTCGPSPVVTGRCADAGLEELEACADGGSAVADGCDPPCGSGFHCAGEPRGCKPLPRAAEIATGSNHTCARFDDGAVRCWGRGTFGQLGYGNPLTIGDDESPKDVGDVSLGGAAAQISAGVAHTCAVLDTGAVRCWGNSASGELGYGSTASVGISQAPEAAGDVPLGGIAVQVGPGGFHTCALLDTGGVRCWGDGSRGALGYGNTKNIGDNETPASAGDLPLGGTAVQVAVGDFHSCALLDTGTARCWGIGEFGRLGYGNSNTIGDNETPQSVGDVPLGGTVVQLSAGGAHSCALLDTGTVRCWGHGENGQLGYGNTNNIGDDEAPETAGDVPVGGRVVQVSAGNAHTCALLDTGDVRCWGSGLFGKLGYGNTHHIGDDEAPESAGNVALGGVPVQLATGAFHTCAVLDTGLARCWGAGGFGQLGYGNKNDIGDNEAPESAGDIPLR